LSMLMHAHDIICDNPASREDMAQAFQIIVMAAVMMNAERKAALDAPAKAGKKPAKKKTTAKKPSGKKTPKLH